MKPLDVSQMQQAVLKYPDMPMGEAIAKEQLEYTLRQVVEELEKDFALAPNDDVYLRLLVRDTLDYWITGKHAQERGAENRQVFLRKQAEEKR